MEKGLSPLRPFLFTRILVSNREMEKYWSCLYQFSLIFVNDFSKNFLEFLKAPSMSFQIRAAYGKRETLFYYISRFYEGSHNSFYTVKLLKQQLTRNNNKFSGVDTLRLWRCQNGWNELLNKGKRFSRRQLISRTSVTIETFYVCTYLMSWCQIILGIVIFSAILLALLDAILKFFAVVMRYKSMDRLLKWNNSFHARK